MNDQPTDPTPADPEVIVVGAGLGGLATAIDLARAGRSVTVLDARSEIGGRSRTTNRDGFLLNEGPHALYRSGAAWAFLTREGLTPAGGEPRADRSIAVGAADMGSLPTGVVSLLRTPVLRGDRLRFARLFATLNRLDVRALDGESISDAVARLVGSRRGADVVHALLRLATYGNDPAAMSAGAAFDQLRAASSTPVLYVDGGWAQIVAGLERRLLDLGGRIERNVKVDAVTQRHRRVALETSSGPHAAHVVVLAAGGPRQVEAMTGVDPAPFARPSTAAVVDVGLRVAWGTEPTLALGLDDPFYLSVHAPTAALAPDGHSLVSVMRYHPHGETADADSDRALLESVLDRVRPGWRDDAEHVEFRARLVACHDQPQAARGGLVGRAGRALPGADRILLAGDWVGPDGLLTDAVFASAGAAASAANEQVARS